MNNHARAKKSTTTPSAQTAALFEKAVHVSLDAIVFTDMDGRLTYVNPAFLRMWGHENADAVIGKTYTTFVESPEHADAIVAVIVRDGRWVGQSRGRRKSGTSFPIDVSAVLITDEAGGPFAMIASVADLSDTQRAETALRGNETAAASPERRLVGGSETLLLVEDEPMLLKVTQAILRRLGYTVLAASTPSQAIRFVEEQGEAIRLVVSDVVMPEMDGPDLVTRLIGVAPHLKCLFVSGYFTSAILPEGVVKSNAQFLQKPFAAEDLAAKVRGLLGVESAT
jgi:PAS domain S-box-containing protein